METQTKKGRKNLIFATFMSIPGPVLLAVTLAKGVSSTQIADLIRRSCELLTIALAWLVFELTQRKTITATAKTRLEAFIKYFTGGSMCASGAIMLYVAIAEFGQTQGSALPSLILSSIGAAINCKLYLNYRKLDNAVLSIQAKLHRVKMLLDCGLVTILLVWLTVPMEGVKFYADLIGTAVISGYLIWNGIRILTEKKKVEGHA